MFHVNCSWIIQSARHKAIYTYTWREVNSKDWNSRNIKPQYQQIQAEQCEEGGEKQKHEDKV